MPSIDVSSKTFAMVPDGSSTRPRKWVAGRLMHPFPPPNDSDQDGMPDAWEREKQLAPNDPRDGNGDRDSDGYTNLEEYLNSLTASHSR